MDIESSSKFIGSLTKFLQSLCNGYVEFQRGVELVGHIYLSIDTGEKVDYVLHEKVSKNDENSVTFVSNSFHAQPLDKEKEKEKTPSKDLNSKGAGAKGLKDTSDDDDDIVILDQTKGLPGSTNSGTIPSRGTKRVASPGSDQRQAQRIRNSGSTNPVLSPTRNVGSRQQSGPSATVTSRDSANDNLNMADVKLEQISRDELLSLASQVGEGGSGPSQPSSAATRPQPQRPSASTGGSGDAVSWIKQEAADNEGADSDTGWSHGRDDSNSNSGSNLYPVMLHQNAAAYSNPVFPGIPGTSAGGPSSGLPYTNPVPGTSQDMGGLDPSGEQDSMMDFQICLAEDAVGGHRRRPFARDSTPVDSIGDHLLMRIDGRKRACRHCARNGRKTQSNRQVETSFFCSLCEIPLCRSECFRNFHDAGS